MCGLDDPGEIVGKTDFDLFSEEVAAGFARDDSEVMETGVPILDTPNSSKRLMAASRHFTPRRSQFEIKAAKLWP